MPAAAISLLPGVQKDWCSSSAGLAPALPSALPTSATELFCENAAAASGKHTIQDHLAAPAASALQQQLLYTAANRTASAHMPADWSFFQRRRAPFGVPGRRSYERPEGGAATALSEQRRWRERRRDGVSTAAQRMRESPRAANAQDRKLRSRELSGARLQQDTVAEAAHAAVITTVAEMDQQRQRRQSKQLPVAVFPEQPAAASSKQHRAASEASAVEQATAAQAPDPPQPQPAEQASQQQEQQQQQAAEQPATPPLPQPQQTGGLSFMVSDASDWALRQCSVQVETPQNSLPLCLQWMDALGSGDIPLLVPSDTLPSETSAAAPAAPSGPPPLPPAPPAGMSELSTGPPVAPLPKLKSLRSRPRRRAKIASFSVAPATPEPLSFGSSPTSGRLARSVSNCSASSRSSGDSGRRASGSSNSPFSVSPFAAYSKTPFEDDE